MRKYVKRWKDSDKIYSYSFVRNHGQVLFGFIGTKKLWDEYLQFHEDEEIELIKKQFLRTGKQQNKHDKKIRKKVKKIMKSFKKS